MRLCEQSMRANTGINRGGNIKLTGEEKSSPLGETMQAYTIYKNITMAICAIGLIYYLICYLRAEDRVKAHYHQYRWRRWEEEHHQLEFNLKIKAYEMLVFILLSMVVVIM